MARPVDCPLPYGDFKQFVRRYPQTELLRAIAATSAAAEHDSANARHPREVSPITTFTLAGIARTSLRAANDHRSTPISADTIPWLCNQYVQIDDPDTTGHTEVDLSRLLAKIMFEQGPSQYSQLENMGRTVSLLLDHRDGIGGAPTDDDWRELLGVDLLSYIRIGFATYCALINNRGSVSRALLGGPKYAPTFGTTSVDEAFAVLDRHFVADIPALRDRCAVEEAAHPSREKWTFNPLSSTPVVSVVGDLIAPVPFYLIEKVTITGLYYTAVEKWGSRFTDALGLMFEQYIGTQLRLLGMPVQPEIVYGSPERKTCDYIVVFDDLLLLVETKSARPNINVRLATAGDQADLDRKIGHARDQLVTTATMIAERHPALSEVPADRPMVGLVVTLEPFHVGRTWRGRSLLDNDTVPITSVCAHDVEGTLPWLVGRADAGQRLLTALSTDEPDARNLRRAADGIDPPDVQAHRNPLIDDAYTRWQRQTAGPDERILRRDSA